MSQTSDPVQEALARYSAAAYDKNVDAFVSLYADDVHVFDMWNSWELRGIGAWREMATGWFSSLGDERVVVTTRDVASNQSGELALGHATLTYTAVSCRRPGAAFARQSHHACVEARGKRVEDFP